MEPAQERARTDDYEKHVSLWNKNEVFEFLRGKGLEDIAQLFNEKQIDGKILLKLNCGELLKIAGVEPHESRVKLLDIIKQRSQGIVYKGFMDPVHGFIEIHPLCVKIIDTPQFQRLRYIKQLGACYYVFPGASHNRFEHSLGVCHLAGQLVRKIQRRQPELDINEADVLCVMIAGLCHDLGHGPFSHLFDRMFIPRANPGSDWQHEEASVKMFEHMIEENDLKREFYEYGLKDTDLKFIKQQIVGARSEEKLECRPKDKHFLYEIVANKRTGIDVDKWDYFARDCHYLGIANSFDHIRIMAHARVLDVPGKGGRKKQICSRDKEAYDLYEMFHSRQRLYRRACHHKTVKIIDCMLTDAMIEANEHLLTKNGEKQMISATIDDMEAYTYITDDVILQILRSTDPKLEKARTIIQQVQKRQLYKCVGMTKPKEGKYFSEEKTDSFEKEIVHDSQLSEKDIVVMILSLDYGKKDKNPIDKAWFYKKNNPTNPIKIHKDKVSRMLPQHFKDQQLYVFCKKLDQVSIDVATECFQKWCSDKDELEDPKEGDDVEYDMAPDKQMQEQNPASDTEESAQT